VRTVNTAAHHKFCDTAHHEAGQAAPPVSAHDDQVGVVIVGDAQNLTDRLAFGEHMPDAHAGNSDPVQLRFRGGAGVGHRRHAGFAVQRHRHGMHVHDDQLGPVIPG
jgi:hypothetical protein